MRPILVVPAVVIVSFAAIHFLEMITGDPLSAVFLALILFVTVAGWFAGSSAARARVNRSQG